MRIFLILGALALLAWWLRGLFAGRGRDPEAGAGQRAPDGGEKAEAVQRMVMCTRCGVHLPKGDATELGNGRFACVHHAQSDGSER